MESVHESADDSSSIPSESDASMAEYYQLQQELWFTSVILAGVIFPVVWFAYSLNVSLNYLIGASIGILYIRLLGKKVEGIGRQQSGLSNARFALIIGVIVIASQVQELAIPTYFSRFSNIQGCDHYLYVALFSIVWV